MGKQSSESKTACPTQADEEIKNNIIAPIEEKKFKNGKQLATAINALPKQCKDSFEGNSASEELKESVKKIISNHSELNSTLERLSTGWGRSSFLDINVRMGQNWRAKFIYVISPEHLQEIITWKELSKTIQLLDYKSLEYIYSNIDFSKIFKDGFSLAFFFKDLLKNLLAQAEKEKIIQCITDIIKFLKMETHHLNEIIKDSAQLNSILTCHNDLNLNDDVGPKKYELTDLFSDLIGSLSLDYLTTILANGKQLANALKGLNSDACSIVIRSLPEELLIAFFMKSESLEKDLKENLNLEDFNAVMGALPLDRFNTALNGEKLGNTLKNLTPNVIRAFIRALSQKNRLLTILTDGEQLGNALKNLTSIETPTFIRSLPEDFLKTIREDDKQLANALKNLTPDVYRAVINILGENHIVKILKEAGQSRHLSIILNCALKEFNQYENGRLQLINEFIQNNILQNRLKVIIADGEQLGNALKNLPLEVCKFIINPIKNHLTTILKDGEQLTTALENLTPEVCDFILNSIQPKNFNTIFTNGKQLGNTVKKLTSETSKKFIESLAQKNLLENILADEKQLEAACQPLTLKQCCHFICNIPETLRTRFFKKLKKILNNKVKSLAVENLQTQTLSSEKHKQLLTLFIFFYNPGWLGGHFGLVRGNKLTADKIVSRAESNPLTATGKAFTRITSILMSQDNAAPKLDQADEKHDLQH